MDTTDAPTGGVRGRVITRTAPGDDASTGSGIAAGGPGDAAAGRDGTAAGRNEAAGSGPMREAVEAAAAARETGGLGRPGRALNRRSPFFIGLTAAAGVAVTYGLAGLLLKARGVLVLIGLALFIAVGLEPAVGWLTRRRVPRYRWSTKST